MTATFRAGLPRRPLAEVAVCPLCERVGCKGHTPDPIHPKSYPFLPGGVDPLADVETIPAPGRVFDPETGILVYGPGDPIPLANARRLGLIGQDTKQAVPGPSAAPEDEPRPRTTKDTPVRTRARQKPRETR